MFPSVGGVAWSRFIKPLVWICDPTMEGSVCSRFDFSVAVRKKRSNTSRRPRHDTPTIFYGFDPSLLLSTPPSDSVSKVSSGENIGYDAGFNVNSSSSRSSSFNVAEGGTFPYKFGTDDGAFADFDQYYQNSTSRGRLSAKHSQGWNPSEFKRRSKGAFDPVNWKSTSKDHLEPQSINPCSYNGNNLCLEQPSITSSGMGERQDSSSHENKLRKVKLKVGGVTHTIHAKSTSGSGASGPTKLSISSDAPRHNQKSVLRDNMNTDNPAQGICWEDFQAGTITHKSEADSSGRISEENVPEKLSHGSIPSFEPVRKSKRVPKRRVLDGAFDEDDEIRYLKRLKTAKASLDVRSVAVGAGNGLSRTSKDGKKNAIVDRESEDTDYIGEEENELGSDMEILVGRKKKRTESVDSLMDCKREITLTTRQRALQSGKDEAAGVNTSYIEFPNGLPPAPSKKQKEKLSEVEQQLKKAEAAQRRRMQNEKAALESQKEAIRKILGQDSTRKKQDEKLRKQHGKLAQEKAAMMIAPNTVRWVMGPTGTTVIFPKGVGLPSIFNSKPCSYPLPREKCAGPSCSNTYKYRDSKMKLPLCSLQCYRAIHEMTQPVTTC